MISEGLSLILVTAKRRSDPLEAYPGVCARGYAWCTVSEERCHGETQGDAG